MYKYQKGYVYSISYEFVRYKCILITICLLDFFLDKVKYLAVEVVLHVAVY